MFFPKNEYIESYCEVYIVLHENKWQKQISPYNFWNKYKIENVKLN